MVVAWSVPPSPLVLEMLRLVARKTLDWISMVQVMDPSGFEKLGGSIVVFTFGSDAKIVWSRKCTVKTDVFKHTMRVR